MKASIFNTLPPLVLLMCLSSGCASSAGKSASSGIFIQSYPPGASVTIDGVPSGTTPARIEKGSLIKPKQIVLEMEGYHDAQLELVPTSQNLELKAINGVEETGVNNYIESLFFQVLGKQFGNQKQSITFSAHLVPMDNTAPKSQSVASTSW